MSKKILRFTFLEKRKSRDFDLYDGPTPAGGWIPAGGWMEVIKLQNNNNNNILTYLYYYNT
jgi:hypothetical protein